jgi:phage recombination protein Bet
MSDEYADYETMEQDVAPGQQAVAIIGPSRLPMTKSIADEFGIDAPTWRVLVDQTFPAARTVEAVLMALSYCRARKLDIFKKPVHIVPMYSSTKRAMVETVWPGIAEIRTTAARTGEYAGIDAVEFGPMQEREFTGRLEVWENRKKVWKDVTKKVHFPEWASVIVHRIVRGQRFAFHAKVFWEETYAKMGRTEIPNEMWEKRARGQLDKCVEAAALRKAFPEEVGSMYAAEEMEGRTIEGGVVVEAPAAPTTPTPPPPPPEEPEPLHNSDQSEGAKSEGTIISGTSNEVAKSNAADAAGDFNDDDSGFVPEGDITPKVRGLLDGLTTTLGKMESEADIEEAFDTFDPQAAFAGNALAMAEAFKVKRAATDALAIRQREELERQGQGSMFPGDLPMPKGGK